MRRREKCGILSGILLPVAALAILICFLTGLSNLSRGQADEDKRRLEEVLRRAAVACYAAEGIYPPDLAYLEEHYGIQINEERYMVTYDALAENLMPDITVLDRTI